MPHDQDEELYRRVARGAAMSSEAIGHLLASARDSGLRSEMAEQQKQYLRIRRRANNALAEMGAEPEKPRLCKRACMNAVLGARTLVDKRTRTLAGLMARGSAMGANACAVARSDCPEAQAPARSLARELEALEVKAEARWREFL